MSRVEDLRDVVVSASPDGNVYVHGSNRTVVVVSSTRRVLDRFSWRTLELAKSQGFVTIDGPDRARTFGLPYIGHRPGEQWQLGRIIVPGPFA